VQTHPSPSWKKFKKKENMVRSVLYDSVPLIGRVTISQAVSYNSGHTSFATYLTCFSQKKLTSAAIAMIFKIIF
jgi:hypothetical protein